MQASIASTAQVRTKLGWHAHEGGQFILVESGVSHLFTDIGAWVIPARRVAWVPPECSSCFPIQRRRPRVGGNFSRPAAQSANRKSVSCARRP